MKNKKMVYVGTYTNDGIVQYEFEQGKLIERGRSCPTHQPSYLITNPKHSILYTVNETAEFNGCYGGGVSAFIIGQTSGELSFLNSQGTHGKHPCHLCLSNQQLFVANYSEGTLSQFPISLDGSIEPCVHVYKHEGSGPVKGRQDGPHVHFVEKVDKLICAVDLGTDQLVYYQNQNNQLNEIFSLKLHPGSGPRHAAFFKSFTYVVNELSNEVVVIKDREIIQTLSTLPKECQELSYAGAIKIFDDHLYVSNRGYDSIAIFEIDVTSGTLSLIKIVPTQGVFPRDFTIIDDYLLVCHQKSNTIVTFKIKDSSFVYLNTINLTSPVCILSVELKH